MKVIFCAVILLTTNPLALLSQGWNANTASNSLFTINSLGTNNNVNVGIGTNIPVAQFHTTGTVRFAGLMNNNSLTRVVVSDNSGNLSFRNLGTISDDILASAWKLNGNTISSTNFIGTLNNQDFRIRTNNTQRMSIDINGNLMINDQIISGATANKKVTVHTNNNVQYMGSVNVTSNLNSLHDGIVIVNTSNSQLDGRGVSIVMQSSSGTPNAYGTAVISGVTVAPNKMDITFQVETDNLTDIQGKFNEVREAMRITNNRFIGMGTSTPSARLHVLCQPNLNGSDIRLQNLPTGQGSVLVIDANGYIYKSTANNNNDYQQMKSAIESQEREIKILKEEISRLKVLSNITLFKDENDDILSLQKLEVFPNPTSSEVIFRWQKNVEQKVWNTTINIYSIDGELKNSTNLDFNLENEVKIDTYGWIKGQYICTIITNGKAVDTRILLVQ